MREAKPNPEKPRQNTLDDVVKRLDALLNVTLRLPLAEDKTLSMKSRVKILHEIGLRNSEIARILGRSQFYVGVVLSEIRKQTSKNKETGP
jgi:hypothetical protein